MRIQHQHKNPTIVLPVQARPVNRDAWTESGAQSVAGGVETAKSRCAGLPGLARQMCYSARYGVSV